jgi:hypothetical protein
MAKWVKCTDTDGDPVFVNMDLAIFVRREGKKTTIDFAGAHVKVRELPEDLIDSDDAADMVEHDAA